MLKTIACIAAAFAFYPAFSQSDMNEQAAAVVTEGKRLYRSEMASWYGTDIFLERYKSDKQRGGYFSYEDGPVVKCVFFSKDATPVVLGTITFDSSFRDQKASVDMAERPFTDTEIAYYTIRNNALKDINTDTMYNSFNGTDLNIVPLIVGEEKKVYVLTGPKNQGVVIFGNDYLLTFDQMGNLISRKRLHMSLIPIYYGKEENGQKTLGAIHNHLPISGDIMTPTDICTLLLYGKTAGWEMSQVVSAKYLSVFNINTGELRVTPIGDAGKPGKRTRGKKRD